MSDLNVTMVAFHGPHKPPALVCLIDTVIEQVRQHLAARSKTAFTPYKRDQIHATILGLEVDVKDGYLIGRWFNRNKRGLRRPVSIRTLHEILTSCVREERISTIRFAGYHSAHCSCTTSQQCRPEWDCLTSSAEFHSCGRSPYEGSFYASSPGPAMITGWPVQDHESIHTFTHDLYAFRRAAEHAGFLDKYHTDELPHWKDDDFFLRLGTFHEHLASHELYALEQSVRDYLSGQEPIILDLNVSDIAILLYDNPSLQPEHVKARVSLGDFLADQSLVESLSQQVTFRSQISS